MLETLERSGLRTVKGHPRLGGQGAGHKGELSQVTAASRAPDEGSRRFPIYPYLSLSLVENAKINSEQRS